MRLPGPNLNLDRTSVRFNRFRFRTSVQNRTSASLDSNGGDEEPGTRDVDDEGSNGDEEDDYGYRDLVDEADNEEDSDDEPLDVADDALGPEDGEGDDDDVNLLGLAAF